MRLDCRFQRPLKSPTRRAASIAASTPSQDNSCAPNGGWPGPSSTLITTCTSPSKPVKKPGHRVGSAGAAGRALRLTWPSLNEAA
ncbi:hypothetical protein G6F24_015552 [Rhizopus arrhizus]|nr:hypothetical protein G6F24_015552 [Rhizopus arrhizus]